MLKLILSGFSLISIFFVFLCNESVEKKFIHLESKSDEFKIIELDEEKKISFIPKDFESYPKTIDSPKFKFDLTNYPKYEQKKDFIFETFILNKNLNKIKNAKLIFISNSEIFTTYSDSNGLAKINFQIDENESFLQTKIYISNSEITQLNIPVSFKIQNNFFILKNISEIIVDTNAEDSSVEIVNENRINKFPKKSLGTIAFEDSYPLQVDSDFNDYIVQFQFEEKIENQKIKSIQGNFFHVAKGSNYSHNLSFKFTGKNLQSILKSNPFLTETILDENNSEIKNLTKNISLEDLKEGILIFEDSKKTISTKNTVNGTSFQKGHRSYFKIEFLNPIDRKEIGFPPYDTYLKVLSSSSSEGEISARPKEIHLPNLYFDETNQDFFLETNHLPFAILVPEIWSWQYEGKDITNERFSGYPVFNQFISSNGILNKDWYKDKVKERVFPVPNQNPNLTAYLQGTDLTLEKILVLGILILFVLVLLYIRKKFLKA